MQQAWSDSMDDTPQSKGGRTRAEKLSASERKEIASQAAKSRWDAEKKIPKATHGSSDHPLKIGDIEIPCYVLEDGTRVLSQRGTLGGLGLSRGSASGDSGGDRLANFATGKGISPFISSDLLAVIEKPIRFRHPGGGGAAYGYPATILPEICEAVLAARKLVDIADGVQASGLSDPYGLCMYKSARSGRFYVIVSDPDGLNRQWELVTRPNGKVAIRQVRDIRFGSQTEGCVADDANGALYIAEEDVALWRVGAEPKAGDARRQVDSVADNPALKDDLEGVSLYALGNGRGYLVVSSQGNNSYAVYDRDGANAYRGSFAVVADGATGIDGISETDGLDVSSLPLGPGFEKGAMVAQDGRNVLPGEKQNFKIVNWADIAAALKLESR